MSRVPASGIAVAAILLTPWAGPVPVQAKDGAPETPAEAMAQAKPLLEALARTAPVANKETKPFKDNADSLRNAVALLKGQSKEGFKQNEFQALWNMAVTLGHWHDVAPHPEYRLEEKRMASHPIRFALPVGRGWSYVSMAPGKNEQCWGEIHRTLGKDRILRNIKIWVYSWNGVYSGIGGENAKGLAEAIMMVDRGKFSKIVSRSDRVVTARMGKGFPKANYYEIQGDETDLGPVKRRNYYVKGSSTTYNFEVIEMLKTSPDDDPWTAWQAAGSDPELDAILDSFEDTGEKKK